MRCGFDPHRGYHSPPYPNWQRAPIQNWFSPGSTPGGGTEYHLTMRKILLLAMLLSFAGCTRCSDCNKVNNPVSPDYPCGTRAHPCTLTPLTCCWNTDVCGGRPDWPGCPAGMCCYVGDDYGAVPASSAPPVRGPTAQWAP